ENAEALRTLEPEARAALLTLVRDNPHPVSQCLLEQLLANGASDTVAGDVEEHLGHGVSLAAEGHTWRLGRPDSSRGCGFEPQIQNPAAGSRSHLPGASGTAFSRDGVILAEFRFIDA